MCQGTKEVYAKCGHVKSKTTIQCQAGLRSAKGLCPSARGRNVCEVKYIEQPAVCETCLTRAIDEKVAAHDRQIRTLQGKISQITERRATVDRVHRLALMRVGSNARRIQEEERLYTKEYTPLMAKKWQLEDELDMTKGLKKEDIAEFLKAKRVYADK